MTVFEERLAELLDRVDNHLDKFLCEHGRASPLTNDAMLLRNEVIGAIHELRGTPAHWATNLAYALKKRVQGEDNP